MLPDTFSQYCEMNNGTEKWPMAPLRTVPAMTHEECMKNERDFNSVYRNALDNPASDPDMANLLKVAGRCKWNITAIQTLYTSICARSSTPEKREKEYVALRKEYSRFLRKLLPEPLISPYRKAEYGRSTEPISGRVFPGRRWTISMTVSKLCVFPACARTTPRWTIRECVSGIQA